MSLGLKLQQAKRIVFYNHWHNGDVHLSRAIVADLMRKLPGKQYVSCHANPPDLLADIKGLEHDARDLARLPMNNHFALEDSTRTVFINTWIGMAGVPYVHQRGGIHIRLLHELMSGTIKDTFGVEMPALSECVPAPDFAQFSIGGVEAFVNADRRRKVLICNGLVQSDQAPSFDFSSFVETLAGQYPKIVFILTNPGMLRGANILYSADIIRKGSPDLNENGYLSTFCDLIVGKSSGPYSFSINLANLHSPKVYLCFCHNPIHGSLGFNEPAFSPQCTFITSSNYDGTAILQLIKQSIDMALSRPQT